MRLDARFTHRPECYRVFLLALLSMGLLSACFAPAIGLIQASGVSILPKRKMRLQVQVAPDANYQSPVALDLLVVYDKTLLQELSKITAGEWFEKRHQFRQDYPVGKGGFESWHWEWVPGQHIPMQRLRLKAKAKGGLIFADYFSPGEHRARIRPRKNRNLRIELRETDFIVQPFQLKNRDRIEKLTLTPLLTSASKSDVLIFLTESTHATKY